MSRFVTVVALVALGCRDPNDGDGSQAGAGASGAATQGTAGAPPPAAGAAGVSGAPPAAAAGSSGGAPATGGSGGAAGSVPSPEAGVGAAGDTDEPDGAVPDGADEVPPTGTFPAASDLSADGPFTPVIVNNTGPGNGYTLYHPQELAPDGVRNPVVSWGNGALTTPVDYDYLLPHLASHGFVVIASNNTMVTGALVRDGVDWIAEQNEDASSAFYQKLDLENVAGVGYSLGGLATYQAADDPRYVTIVIISGANMSDSARAENMPKLHTPTAYLCTADDASRGNCEGDYAVVEVPAFFGVLNGSVHTSVTELLGLGDPAIMGRLAYAVTGWLRWQQMADSTREAMFLGDDCELCQDTDWTVEPQKNWN